MIYLLGSYRYFQNDGGKVSGLSGQPCYYAIPGSLEGLEADLDGFAEAGHICPSPWPVCPAGEGLRQSPCTLQGLCNRLPFNLSHSCNVVKWEMFVEVWPLFVYIQRYCEYSEISYFKT